MNKTRRGQGGAIETTNGQLTLSQTDFTRNFAGNNQSFAGGGLGDGGAVRASGNARVLVSGGNFLENGATLSGGALWSGRDSVLRVDGAKFNGNVANGDESGQGGGAIVGEGAIVSARNATFGGNSATGALGSGGAILSSGGRLELSDSALTSNFSVRAGGAIETAGGARVTMGRCFFSGNFSGPNGQGAPGNGGALHMSGADFVAVSSSEFASNAAAKRRRRAVEFGRGHAYRRRFDVALQQRGGRGRRRDLQRGRHHHGAQRHRSRERGDRRAGRGRARFLITAALST